MQGLLGGTASSRYHRPGGGIGLNNVTAAHLRSLTMALEHVDIFTAEPKNDLLQDRHDDEAYVAAVVGKQYVVYFPRGGEVQLDARDANGTLKLRWIEVLRSQWDGGWESVESSQPVRLKVPGEGPWVAVLIAD